MKTSEHFKQTIKNYLEKRAAEDELFAKTYAKENKSIDECCNYVMKCAKEGGCAGYSDEEVFGWAVHYYDEDDIKDIKPISARVVVNNSVELTEEEKVKAKEMAFKAEKDKYIPEVKEELKKTISLTPEEIAEAKEEAKKLAVSEALEKMKSKKKPEAKEQKPEEVQPDLFS